MASNIKEILDNRDLKRKKELAQQTAPVSFATGERREAGFEERFPGIASILKKTQEGQKYIESVSTIKKSIPYTVDESDYDTYEQRVRNYISDMSQDLASAKPSTKGILTQAEKQRGDLSREGTGLMIFAGGTGKDQNAVQAARHPLMGAYDKLQQKMDELNNYARDVDWDLDKNVDNYEDWKRILSEQTGKDEIKTVIEYGQNTVDKGTEEVARQAAAGATDNQLQEMLQTARTGSEQQAIKAEINKRTEAKALTEEEQRNKIYSALDADEKAYVDGYAEGGLPVSTQEMRAMLEAERDELAAMNIAGGLAPEEKRANALRIYEIDAAIGTEGATMGPEPMTPEMAAYNEWQDQQRDVTFAERYVAENKEDANDWVSVYQGNYQGNDEEKRQHSDQYSELEERYMQASLSAETGTDLVSGRMLSSQEILDARQQAQELLAQMEAMDQQAKEQYSAAMEKANSVNETLNEKGSFTRILETAVKKGFTGYADKFYQAVDIVLGKPINAVGQLFDKDFENPYSKWARTYRESVYNPAASEAEKAIKAMGGGIGWEIASETIRGMVENIPNTLMAIMSGGASAAAGMADMQSAAAEAMASQGTGAATQLAQNLLSDFNYWTSFMQEIGGDYQEAVDAMGDNVNPVTASIYAMVTCFINAGIEIGGEGSSGIQGIGKDTESRFVGKVINAVAGRDLPLLESILDSGTDEALEELKQGIVSGLAMKAIVDHDLQWISTDGSDAVFNAQNTGKSMLIGFVTGAGLAGISEPAARSAQQRGQIAENTAIGSQVINNDFGKALAGIAEDAAGIRSDFTAQLKDGSMDTEEKSVKRKTGELYKQVMEKLDDSSYAALQKNVEASFEKALANSGYRFNISGDARIMTKAFTKGVESLGPRELAKFKEEGFRKAYEEMTGSDVFQNQYDEKAMRKAEDTTAAMHAAAVMASEQGSALSTAETDRKLEAAGTLAQKAKISEDKKLHINRIGQGINAQAAENATVERTTPPESGTKNQPRENRIGQGINAQAAENATVERTTPPESGTKNQPRENRIGQGINAQAAEDAIIGVSVQNGKVQVKVKTNGGNELLSYDEVQFPNQETAERVAMAATLGGEQLGSTLLNAKEPGGKTFAEYAKDFMASVQAAKMGLGKLAIKHLGFANNLTDGELRTAVWAGEKLTLTARATETVTKQIALKQKEYVKQKIIEHVGKNKLDAKDAQEVNSAVLKLALEQKIKPSQKALLEKYGINQQFVDSLKDTVQPVRETAVKKNVESVLDAVAETEPQEENGLDAVETAKEYGLAGLSMEELEENLKGAGMEMTSAARVAYNKGETERIEKERNRIQEIQKLNQGGDTQQRKGVVRSVKQADIEQIKTRTGMQVNRVTSAMNDQQRAAIKAMRIFANDAGLKFVLFESPVGENGQRQGANGWYDQQSDTIYLDMFAGQENEAAVGSALAHEMTHWIQRWNPEEYAKMRDFLLKAYAGQGKATVSQLIAEQIRIGRQNGLRYTETNAVDELMADASEMMFSHPEVMQELAEKQPTLFERIKGWLDKLVESLRKAMEGIDPQHREARLLLNMQKTWEEYQRMWYTAAQNAGSNMRYAAESNTEAQTRNEVLAAEPVQDTETEAVPRMIGERQQIESQPETVANTGTAYTNDQTPVNYHYELVVVDDLIASNTQRFEANPEYPQELQPRDRTRQASREQVYTIAQNLNPARLGESADVQNGAPIVGNDLVVESGNGRTMALRYAMQNMPEQAAKYTNWLRKNAARFGLNAEDVKNNSVLVRVRDSAMNRLAFVKAANESTTAAYSESETAESDAEKLTPEMMEVFEPGENGRLDTAENMGFANRFMEGVIPAAERGNYMQKDGTISQRGWERMQNAVFQRAYGSAALTQQLSESTDEGARNILKALIRAAPRTVQTAQKVQNGSVYDIMLGQKLTDAARRYMQLKRDGIRMDTYLNQIAMPGLEMEDEGTQALMRVFEDLGRAPNRMANVLRNVMDLLEEYGDPRQVRLLGENQAPDAAALVTQAVSREAQQNANGVKYSLRDTELDAEYMQAVEDGDEEKQQRLVDEAAEDAMRDSKIRDEDGRLLTVYHGTSERFTVFDMGKGRANMDIQGSFFSPWAEDAEGYGENVGRYYLNIKNPASEAQGYRVLNMFKGQNGAGVKAREYLIGQGYDGVNNGNEEYIAFYPEQIKSADPVTYDDVGSVIPLSERFNEQKPDIRFSQRYTAANGIEEGMTDGERYEKLKGTQIRTMDATNGLSARELLPFKTMSYRVATRPMTEIARRYGLIRADGNEAKTLTNAYLTNLPAKFSRASLNESIEKQRTGLANMAALMPVFEETYKNAVPVLVQGNRYLYTAQDESDTNAFMYLLGGFKYAGNVIPVQFELKQNNNPDDNSVYVVATIKKDAITALKPANATPRATASSTISIEGLISLVKGDETKILPNLPNQFLTEEQKEGKRKGLREKGRHTNEKALKAGRNVNAQVNMTEERIDRDIAYYGGSGDYSKAYMTYISPSDYLLLTASNEERIANESRVLVAAELRKNEQTPFLKYDQETGEITGHEGRHRMMAMKNAGVQQVAILMIPDGSEGRSNRHTISNLVVSGQDFGFAKAPGTTTLNNLIPVNQKHRQELIDTYGESRNWFQYSQRDTEYRTNRQILADALTSIAANENERQMLEAYKDVAGRLDMNERRISQINQQIRDIRLEEPNSDREKALLAERRQLEAEITAQDKRLYAMERMAPLQRIANQQRAKAENEVKRIQESVQRYRQGVVQRERINSITRTSRRLTKWLTAPAGKSGNYVPESLRAPLGEFLLTIDKMSQQRRAGGPMTQEDRQFAYQLGQITRMLQNIDDSQQGTSEEAISSQYSMYLDLPREFTRNLSELVQRVEKRMQETGAGQGGNMLDQMTPEELETLDESMKAISTSISNINSFMTDAFSQGVRETAAQTIQYLNGLKPLKAQSKAGKAVSDFITWDNLMPVYAFERMGEKGTQVFNALRQGQDQLAKNAKKIIDESKETYKAKEAKEWSAEIKEFDFATGKIRIPVANIMSLYCLSKREQGIGHLYGEGIRVADFEEGKGPKKRTVRDTGHVISEAQVQTMISSLTPRQKEVADKLQHIMSTTGSKWGNHVSMRRFGFKQFTEKNYFPIKSDTDLLPARTDNGSGNELYKLLNMSAAKPLTPRANNRLMLENIFDVYSSHMADMAQYNALALPVLDAVKWFNYKESTQEEGETAKYTSGVRDSMRNAYGQSAIKYIQEFLKDINGGAAQNDTSVNMMQKALGKYNRVAVAANLRVALLQPLAIIRAGMELPGTSLASGTIKAIPNLKSEVKEMQEQSGIALWKDLGYREMNIGRSVKQQIRHTETWQDWVSDKSMALAEVMDNVTWGAMWKASKEYINCTQPTLARGSEEYFKAVTQKFEDVVYKTQVVDSILTKSQLMRSQNAFNKLIGSFMSEPTTTFNQLMATWDKFRIAMKQGNNFSQAWQKHGKTLGRTMYYYLLAAAVNTAIEQLMTAYRDDDDYETMKEKYMDGFWETMLDNANPLTLIPGVKNLWEQGAKKLLGMETFDDQNVLTEGINTVVDGIQKITGEKGTVWGRAYTLSKGLSMTSGLPFHPLMREFQALWNQTAARIQPNWRLETSPTSNATGYDIIYKAYGDQDDARYHSVYQRMLDRGVEDQTIANAMTTRIKKDYDAGNISDAEAETRLFDMVYGGLTADTEKKTKEIENKAYFKVQEWKYENENEDDYSRFDNLKNAIISGGNMKEAEKELLDHGYTQKQVDAKKKTLITDAAKAGEITDAQATTLFTKHTDLDKDEAYWRLQSAHYEKEDDDDSFKKYGKLAEAVLTGKGYDTAKKELISHGVKEADVTSQVRSIITEQVVKKGMNDAKATQLLKTYGGMTDNEAWIRIQEMTYQKKTGKSTSADTAMVIYAIDNNQSPQTAIDGLLAHGKEKSGIASSLTSHYKEDYLELLKTDKTKAATLKGRLVSIFEYLGYDGLKKVDDWEKQKKTK